MNRVIRKIGVLALMSMSLLFVSSCRDKDKDNDPPKPMDASKINGTVFTEKSINANNTLQAVTEIVKENEEDIEEILGSTTIKDKKFSLSLSTPKHLEEGSIKDNLGTLEGVNISNPDVKIISLGALELLNGGTMPSSSKDFVFCSNELPKLDTTIGGITIKNIVVYMYSDSDVTIKGTATPNEDETVKVNFDLSLKKGWNLVLNREKENSDREVINISSIPANYKWYLLGDLMYPNTNTGNKKMPSLKNMPKVLPW